MAPMTFELSSFVTSGSELLDDFQGSFCQPFWWHVAAVIELEVGAVPRIAAVAVPTLSFR
jgi:hypothetical protein